MSRIFDSKGNEIFEKGRGKRDHQKIKPYIVLQYLLKYSDEDHIISTPEIIEYLHEIGIDAERRSIYKDVEEVNAVLYMLENDCNIYEAEEALADGEEPFIVSVSAGRNSGFYVNQRKYEFDDIRLLAEAVYSSKFIPEGQAKNLIDVVCGFVSEPQAEKIKHDAFLVDRTKTANKKVLYNVSTINTAMRNTLDGRKKNPEKISFKYLKHTINDLSGNAERRKGEKYIVSPYRLLINDGNYYLLAYNDYYKDMRTYRVDRMKDVSCTGETREGEEIFKKIDMASYTQRVFGMYGGDQRRMTLRFINPLLDAVVDRFGTTGVSYSKVDDTHFQIIAAVEISEQFFSWVCGFGNKVKITDPEDVIEQFKAYLEKIRSLY